MEMAKPRTQGTAPRVQEERAMFDEKKVQELYGQFAGKTVETMTVWADANQRVLRELVELSAATAKEGVRLYAELQQGAIEALKDSQATALRWQAAWQEGAAKDPVQACQKVLLDGVDGAQKAFKAMEDQAQAVTRSAERLQTSAEQAAKGIQETYTSVVTKLKDVYSQN
jgi:hypothetical protein